MLFQKFIPHVLLLPFVEVYWAVSGYGRPGERQKVLPDGSLDIIFSFGEAVQPGLNPILPNIVGTMTRFSEISYIGKVDMLGIRFAPGGFTAFTRMSISEFTDCLVDLTVVDSLFDTRFYAELPDKTSPEERVRHIDSYLLGKLKHIFMPDSRIIHAVRLIRETAGNLPLTQVAQESCLSLRHFERRFKADIGVSPKTFSKISKFQHTKSYLRKNQKDSLLTAAVNCGYYDQAHLIKDFKSLSGDAPSFFKE